MRIQDLKLEEIIGAEEGSLYLSTDRQIADLCGAIDPSAGVRGEFTEWRLVTLQIHRDDFQDTTLHLIGMRGDRLCTLTSHVVSIDLNKSYCKTRNSIYSIPAGARGKGEPTPLQLVSVCKTLWKWELGFPLDVLVVFRKQRDLSEHPVQQQLNTTQGLWQ